VSQNKKNNTLAFTDFVLSRRAKLCSESTIRIYKFTLGRFLDFLADRNPEARFVREFLAGLVERQLSDSYISIHARVIKTFLRFCYAEGYTENQVRFDMPRIGRKSLSFLKPEQLPTILNACRTKRDKAIILFMVDSGLRRAEVCDLRWNDIDINSGVVNVRKGKGGKSRIVVIGVKARRALLAYAREIDADGSVFGLTANGLRSMILRISTETGIKFTPHSLRRTFATLSLKAGMNLVHIQGLMGHSSIEMTRDYIQALTEDYIEAHNEHSPIDKFYPLKS